MSFVFSLKMVDQKIFIFLVLRIYHPRNTKNVEESDLEKTSILLIFAIMTTVTVLFAGCTNQQPANVTSSPTLSVTTGASTTQASTKTIVETLGADGRFTTFIAALQAANLTETLSSDGPYTVFAPTDDAFKNLTEGSMDTLLKDPQGDLLQILLYHVVNGKVMATDLENLTSVDTLQGGSLPISVSNGKITVDGATVIITDIECSNGVIHVIDTVMLPPA